MRLAIKSSGHPLYIASTQEIEQAIAAGEPIHRAPRLTGHFPVEFADAVQVGEDSGAASPSRWTIWQINYASGPRQRFAP